MADHKQNNLKMQKAESGREYWFHNHLSKYDFILHFPHADHQLNTQMLSAFETKLQSWTDKNGGNCPSAVVLSSSAIFKSKFFATELISEEISDNILALYSLYAFTDKLIVGSFDLPHGRKLRNLLDSGIATEDELINDVILGAM